MPRMDSSAPPDLNECFIRILREGPPLGIHTLIWCDTYPNMTRVLDTGAIEELGLRVAGALSVQESHSLFDSARDSRIDKPFRMLKYDDAEPREPELFRPYEFHDTSAIERVGQLLRQARQALN